MVKVRSIGLAITLSAWGLSACFDLDRIHVAASDAGVTPGRACGPGRIPRGEDCVDEPVSCQAQTAAGAALARTCGPNRNDSCCAYDLVDTRLDPNHARFDRSFDVSEVTSQENMPLVGWQARGRASAIVSPFYLDRYEVTVGRFKALYQQYDDWLDHNPLPADGAGEHLPSTRGGWRARWKNSSVLYAVDRLALDMKLDDRANCHPDVARAVRSADTAHDDRPMTCINWYEALLFCIFDGGRLPTEAEWNFAAAGGSEQRAYPWSKSDLTTSADLANVAAPNGAFRLEPVGSFPKGIGRFGQYDLAGNAIEWVHGRCSDCASYETNEQTDPIEMDGPTAMPFPNAVARGGSFRFPWVNARTAYRQQVGHTDRYRDTGWRCARNHQP